MRKEACVSVEPNSLHILTRYKNGVKYPTKQKKLDNVINKNVLFWARSLKSVISFKISIDT